MKWGGDFPTYLTDVNKRAYFCVYDTMCSCVALRCVRIVNCCSTTDYSHTAQDYNTPVLSLSGGRSKSFTSKHRASDDTPLTVYQLQ